MNSSGETPASAPAAGQREAVLSGFFELSPELRRAREEKLRRILRDDGATHHVGAAAQRSARAWGLELLPSVVERAQWAAIEAGLAERAGLLDRVLADLYGERTLIRAGVLPPEVLFVHPGFLRSCDRVKAPGRQLLVHAVDLIERADGLYCAVADRAQVPRGIGYALENRTVLSRVVPQLFRSANVQRLSPFFSRLRAALLNVPGTEPVEGAEEPNVVLLSPGPDDEAYFEQAYLANYLGLPLVQSGDLLVRQDRVWLKSLDGLSPVDVIFRHVSDWASDPLELQSDSLHGVPGLLGVAREGGARIVNPIGAGALENPALPAFLPAIGRHFLGREPVLASVPTYWCGDPEHRDYVTRHLDDLVLLPIDERLPRQTLIRPGALPSDERARLVERLEALPHCYAAQALPERSEPPVVGQAHDHLAGRPMVTRAFCVADGDGYAVMPGGLARRETEPTGPTQPHRRPSQDTWIVSFDPPSAPPSPFLDRQGRFKLPRRLLLPSRVVENLFWMGRYAERSEVALRLLRTVFLALNSPEPLPRRSRGALLIATTRITGTRPGFEAPDADFDAPDEELLSIVLDAKRAGSIRANLNGMLTAADNTKELLSSDTLRVINDIEDANDALPAAFRGGLASAPEEALDPLVTALLALAGLTHESMIRGLGWRFLAIGRRLERALQLIGLCRSLLVRPLPEGEEEEVLQALFLTLEMLITYRRRYRGRVELPQGFELLLIDRSNPRSLLFQLEVLARHVDDLPRPGIDTRELLPEQRALLRASTALRLAPLVSLHETDREGVRVHLDALLGELRAQMLAIGSEISERYFEHRVDAHQLVPTVWEGE